MVLMVRLIRAGADHPPDGAGHPPDGAGHPPDGAGHPPDGSNPAKQNRTSDQTDDQDGSGFIN